MPNWQHVNEAYLRLRTLRERYDEAMALVVNHRNPGALDALRIIALEAQRLDEAFFISFDDAQTTSVRESACPLEFSHSG